MPKSTKTKAVKAAKRPTKAEVAHAKEYLIVSKSKIRAGSKMTVELATNKVLHWPIIEIWDKDRRRYMPLQIGDVWRYCSAKDRDAVLGALTK